MLKFNQNTPFSTRCSRLISLCLLGCLASCAVFKNSPGGRPGQSQRYQVAIAISPGEESALFAVVGGAMITSMDHATYSLNVLREQRTRLTLDLKVDDSLRWPQLESRILASGALIEKVTQLNSASAIISVH